MAKAPVPKFANARRSAANAVAGLALLVCGVLAPVPAGAANAAAVAAGKHLFNQMCSHCHGIDMVNPGNSSFDLRRFPPGEEARFRHSVMGGKNAMPAWGDILKPAEIDALWAYISTGGKP
jgi:mono/diheme cytochrome c family protein